MVISRPGEPLAEHYRPIPRADGGNVVLRVVACAVCRTDLHVLDGELPEASYPVIPGRRPSADRGSRPRSHARRGRMGRHWLARIHLRPMRVLADRENLCERARFHG